MSKLNQKDAVFNAVSSVLSEAGVTFNESTDVRPSMTKEFRAQVNQILFDGFRAGNIELDAEKTDSELKSYVSGLQSNWLNKDKRLNGGTKYIAKNPGSRAGMQDPQIKALRALMASKTETAEIAEIQSYIDSRLKEIKVTKSAKDVVIDFSQLPEALQTKYHAE